jgi:hypothetical protein
VPPGSISSQGQISRSWTWQQGAEGVVRERPGSVSSQGQTSHLWTWQQGVEGIAREPVLPLGSISSQGQIPQRAWQQGAKEVVREPVPPPGFISSQGRQIPNSWACQQGAEEVVREPVPASGSISSQGQIPHSWTWQQGAEGVVREPVTPLGSISSQEQIPNSWACQQGAEEMGRGSTTPRAGALDGDSIPFVPGMVIEKEDIRPSPHELRRAKTETSGLLTSKPQDTCAVSGAEDPLGLVAALRERLQQMTAGLERVKAAADRLHERLDGPDSPLADPLNERLDAPDAPLADCLHERLDGPDGPLADHLHERLDGPDAPLADSPSSSSLQPDGAAIGCSKTSIRADTTEVLKNRQTHMSDSPYPCSSEPPEAVPQSMAVEEQPKTKREVKETSVSRDFIPTGLSNLSAQISHRDVSLSG